MRAKNCKIRLLVIDNPTSELDPSAEYDIFSHFRDIRNGKTVIYVPHRFGRIAKYADLILWVFLLLSYMRGITFDC